MIYEAKITSTRRKLFLSPRLSRYWIWWRTLSELEQTNNQLSTEYDSLLLTDSVQFFPLSYMPKKQFLYSFRIFIKKQTKNKQQKKYTPGPAFAVVERTK